MIAGVSPIIVRGMKMSVSGPEMILGVASIVISRTEKVVSLRGLIADDVPMIVSESSMTGGDAEIVFNETELIVFVSQLAFASGLGRSWKWTT
ncbi:MAG: hypothetical protein AUI91_07025 [Acidobacteria bacterium 13_1_40CM_3_56_11]|nr:MAG: hypothetical protein AUI91_07025 [Acidobacteria bacterium 13_1_40CM_3_56_11]